LRDHLELLGVTAEVPEELLWILCLFIVLLFFVNDFFELTVANRAVALANIAFDALVVEGVATHEQNDWQRHGMLAALAVLRVEVLSLALQLLNLLSH